MSDELTQEQQEVLATITTTRGVARAALADKLEVTLGDIDALAPLYPDGLPTDLQQIRNYLSVMISRLRTRPAVVVQTEQG